jgi:hypothetical protein
MYTIFVLQFAIVMAGLKYYAIQGLFQSQSPISSHSGLEYPIAPILVFLSTTTIYRCAVAQTVGQTSMVLASMAMATPMSLTWIHPSKDPGIVKSKLSITSRKRYTANGTGFEDEELPDASSFFFSSTEPFGALGAAGPKRRSETVSAIAIQIA